MATYPGAAKTFTAKFAGETIQPAHVNDLQDEVTALEQDLVAGLAVARGGTGATDKTTGFDALSPMHTVGDLIVHDGANNVRLAAGTSGQVLSTGATGALAWIARGGIVGLSNYDYATELPQTSAGGWASTNLQLSYTPSSASNYLLVLCSMPFYVNNCVGEFRLTRDGVEHRRVRIPTTSAGTVTWAHLIGTASATAQVWAVQFQYVSGSGGGVYSCYNNTTADLCVIEFGAV